MQWRGGGLAVRAARFRAAVEPQMRAVGGGWTPGLGSWAVPRYAVRTEANPHGVVKCSSMMLSFGTLSV